MALQRRFWNWKDDDLTFDLARAFIGLIEHGLYRGFDPVLGETLNLSLNHLTTGATRVTKALIQSNRYGIVVTKQGVFIQEEEVLGFAITPTTEEGRKDLVVVTHNYEDIEGGIEALYSVITGTAADYPALTNPEKQEILGYLTLPPNCTALNQLGVTYIKAKQPNFANHVDFIEKSGGSFLTVLDATGNSVINLSNPINPQDAATKFYVDQAIANNIVFASEAVRGIIQLATIAEGIAGEDLFKAITPKVAREIILSWVASQAQTNDDEENTKFITPKTLANRTATETRKGVARISTEAEAIAGEDDTTIITPYKLKKALPLIPFVLELGAWDIEASPTRSLPHTLGANWDKVVSVNIVIKADDQSRIVTPNISENNFEHDVTNASVTLDTTGLTLADFNNTGVNRGFITFWLKLDIPPVTGVLTINAGSDLSLAPQFLVYGTPVLRTLEKTSNAYPANQGELQATVELGIGSETAALTMQYQRASDSTWVNFGLDITPVGDTDRTLKGKITDTAITGLYPIRVRAIIGGGVSGITMYSNTINVNLNLGTGTEWQDLAAASVVSYHNINLNGFAESIGSALTSVAWTVESQPVDSDVILSNPAILNPILNVDKVGEYVLKLTGTNATGTAFDTITVNVLPYVNNAPVITALSTSPSAYAEPDYDFIADYDPELPFLLGYFKMQVQITASDIDGDLLLYDVKEVVSYNPFTGVYGAVLEPQTITVEQLSPSSSILLVRGMTGSSATSDNSRIYNFKGIVDDGRGGIAERGFRIKVVPTPITAPVGVTASFTLDTDPLAKVYVGSARIIPYSPLTISAVTAYITAAGAGVGSLAALASFGVMGGTVVPVGTIVDVTDTGSLIGETLSIPVRFELTGTSVSLAVLTIRAYDNTGALVATATRNITL